MRKSRFNEKQKFKVDNLTIVWAWIIRISLNRPFNWDKDCADLKIFILRTVSFALPELVFQVDDLSLLGLVLCDEVFQLSLDLSPLSFLARNLLLCLVQGPLKSLESVVDLEKKNLENIVILDFCSYTLTKLNRAHS